MKKSQKGFTLVELIVVIAIIGVLAAILVPSMMGYVKKSRLKSANSNAKLVYTTINGCATDLQVDGKIAQIKSSGSSNDGSPVQISSLKSATKTEKPLEYEIYKALSDNGEASGYACWKVQGAEVKCAQWASSEANGEIVGQFPDPITDTEDIGASEKIGGTLAKSKTNYSTVGSGSSTGTGTTGS